jgi:hypothetical protein
MSSTELTVINLYLSQVFKTFKCSTQKTSLKEHVETDKVKELRNSNVNSGKTFRCTSETTRNDSNDHVFVNQSREEKNFGFVTIFIIVVNYRST